MKIAAGAFAALALSCGQPTAHGVVRVRARPETTQSNVSIRESFSTNTLDSFKSNYVIVAPGVRGAVARWEDRAIVLTMPAGSDDEIIARRSFDISFARGLRLRLRVRVRTDKLVKSFARATIAMRSGQLEPSYHDNASTSRARSMLSTDIYAVMDVPPDALSGQIDLVLHGTGTAWFEEVEVEVVGRSPPLTSIALSPQQISSLVSFSRAAALIRYLHPSDQSADLDWDTFLPTAIAQILRCSSPADLLSSLRRIFKPIAPTVTFSSAASPVEPARPPGGDGLHLVRWRRYGFGEDPPFASYRDGRDTDTTFATALTRLALPDLKACKSLSLRVEGQRIPGTGKTAVMARLFLPARKNYMPLRHVQTCAAASSVRVTMQVPSRLNDLHAGLA